MIEIDIDSFVSSQSIGRSLTVAGAAQVKKLATWKDFNAKLSPVSR
jgi:hypothetical protein